MFAKFLIVSVFMFIGGPIENEGLSATIQEAGPKAAIVQLWENRDRTAHNDPTRYNN